MKVGGVIIAGGQSRRMGDDKLQVRIRGERLIDLVVSRLNPQVDRLAINANDGLERFELLGLPCIADGELFRNLPMAGLHAALRWAGECGFSHVLTSTGDTPFLPSDLRARLAGDGTTAVAASGGRTHFLTGLWRSDFLPVLERGAAAIHRAEDVARLAGARVVSWSEEIEDPFFNINTPEDLAEARRRAGGK
jgi:molybdopterin-guanine dinucleotide biosynthesis protein A